MSSRRVPLLGRHRLGRGRIFQVIITNKRPSNIHALGGIKNRNLAAINDQGDAASFSVSIQGLADILLQWPEQILIALLILGFGIFASALEIPFLLIQGVDLGLDLRWSCAARLL